MTKYRQGRIAGPLPAGPPLLDCMPLCPSGTPTGQVLWPEGPGDLLCYEAQAGQAIFPAPEGLRREARRFSSGESSTPTSKSPGGAWASCLESPHLHTQLLLSSWLEIINVRNTGEAKPFWLCISILIQIAKSSKSAAPWPPWPGMRRGCGDLPGIFRQTPPTPGRPRRAAPTAPSFLP